MSCVKLNILDEQHKRTEQKVSSDQKELTSEFSVWNVRKLSVHGNHLSSTQMITDGYALVVQRLVSAPFGEQIREYNVNWDERVPRYTFGAKEYDEENSMFYYEARYHKPPTFISRDPKFEEYPYISAYSYCENNPVKYIDPDGKATQLADPLKVVKGALVTAGGVVSVASGVALCAIPIPGPQAAGVALITFGVPAVGFGVAQTIDAIQNDGKNNIPSGMFEAIGQGIDDKHGTAGQGAAAGKVLDFAAGGGVTSEASAVIEVGKVVVDNIIESTSNNTQKQTTPTNNKPNSATKNTVVSTVDKNTSTLTPRFDVPIQQDQTYRPTPSVNLNAEP